MYNYFIHKLKYSIESVSNKRKDKIDRNKKSMGDNEAVK